MSPPASTKRSVKDCKILICPHEIGGQMQLLAEELRRQGYYATAATYNPAAFDIITDIHLNITSTKSKLKRQVQLLAFSAWAASNYDIFHFFWGDSLYRLGPFMHPDLPLLRRAGKKVFVHFRGIDIVDLAYFDYLRARTAGDAVQEPAMSRPDQLKSVASWRKHSHKMLVSEPDLLRVVPEAEMVQQAVDLAHWQPERPRPLSDADGLIRIAHAPSLRRKKGTEFVQEAVAELKAAGHPVELVLIEGQPHHEMKRLYEECDIGVDQVLYGWYGKVSIELMALRKPAVCYIDEELKPHRPDMPIVSADPKSLAQRLRELVEDAELRRRLGEQGREYVRRHHDLRSIAEQCLRIYEETYQAQPARAAAVPQGAAG